MSEQALEDGTIMKEGLHWRPTKPADSAIIPLQWIDDTGWLILCIVILSAALYFLRNWCLCRGREEPSCRLKFGKYVNDWPKRDQFYEKEAEYRRNFLDMIFPSSTKTSCHVQSSKSNWTRQRNKQEARTQLKKLLYDRAMQYVERHHGLHQGDIYYKGYNCKTLSAIDFVEQVSEKEYDRFLVTQMTLEHERQRIEKDDESYGFTWVKGQVRYANVVVAAQDDFDTLSKLLRFSARGQTRV